MYWNPSGIGAEYMFCIHASGASTPIATIEAATARWLKIGLRAIVGRTSDATPAPNRTTMA